MKELLISLVRAASGNLPADGVEILRTELDRLQEAQWKELFELAGRQGVAAFVWDTLEGLVNDSGLRIPRELMLGWAGVAMSYEQRYLKYTLSIGRLARLLASHGVGTMVLKGYCSSLDWPVPAHRPCGDIDIWNFGEQQKADGIVASKGIKVDGSHHHHTVFFIGGFMVENHYDFINVHAHRSSAQIEKELKRLAGEEGRLIKMPDTAGRDGAVIPGGQIVAPPVQFNALFLIAHLAAHFGGEDITLRQLLDWAFFVRASAGAIDWKTLQENCRRWNKIRFLDAVNAICVRYLGFEKSLFPVSQRDEKLEDRILADILEPEFSEAEPAKKSLLRTIPFKYRRLKAHRWKNEIVYPEKPLPTMLRLVWSHLLKPSSMLD